jgi:hypothetical protein
MDDIVLKGDELQFWKGKADLIEVLADKDNELVLSRDLFPNFDDDDWNFLRKFLHKEEVSYTKSKKYGTFIYNIKGYTRRKADAVLDFIMYGKKIGNIDRVLNARRIRPRMVLMNGDNGNNNNRKNNNNNNNNNNNYNTSYKKRKYNTGVRVNNNNNNNYTRRKPYAKSKGKTKNRRR